MEEIHRKTVKIMNWNKDEVADIKLQPWVSVSGWNNYLDDKHFA